MSVKTALRYSQYITVILCLIMIWISIPLGMLATMVLGVTEFIIANSKKAVFKLILRFCITIQIVIVFIYLTYSTTLTPLHSVRMHRSDTKSVSNNNYDHQHTESILSSLLSLSFNSYNYRRDLHYIPPSESIKSSLSHLSRSYSKPHTNHNKKDFGNIQTKKYIQHHIPYPASNDQILLSLFQYPSNFPPFVTHPDLMYRSDTMIKESLYRIFTELPSSGFLSEYKNPCWFKTSPSSTPSSSSSSSLSSSLSLDSNAKKIEYIGQYVHIDTTTAAAAAISLQSTLHPHQQHLQHHLYATNNTTTSTTISTSKEKDQLVCLPYFYILGQPKCGTSDLYERLKNHPDISKAKKKEIRWFTRGKFTTRALPLEGYDGETAGRNRPHELRLSDRSSLYSFTTYFDSALSDIISHPSDVITFDGGPHTLWWSTQQPDGTVDHQDIPPVQILRVLQPSAKFIVSLKNPVSRMYSDYLFLNDDRTVAIYPHNTRHHSHADNNQAQAQAQAAEEKSKKSPQQFHDRVVLQIQEFHQCVTDTMNTILLHRVSSSGSGSGSGNSETQQLSSTQLSSTDSSSSRRRSSISSEQMISHIDNKGINGTWFRASQICAHDRYRFGKAGWGRLNIGLYSLFLFKWFEHFHIEQFYITRLEDYDKNRQQYLLAMYDFLGVRTPTEQEWESIITNKRYNENRTPHLPMLEETKHLLRAFYQPYNDLLVLILNDTRYHWKNYDDKVDEDSSRQRHTKSNEDVLNTMEIPQLLQDLPIKHHIGDTTHTINEPNSQHKIEDSHIHSIDSIFTPRAFSIEGLPMDNAENYTMSDWLSMHILYGKRPLNLEDAMNQLTAAIVAMDLQAIKYLLYNIGVPVTINHFEPFYHPPLHTLALLGAFGEGHGKSYVYSLLKGQSTWITPLLQPPLPHQLHSVLSADIITSLEPRVMQVLSWLMRAGANITEIDNAGYSALDYAVVSGFIQLVQYLLEHGAQVNRQSLSNGRTPLHWAIVCGHIDIAAILIQFGADLHLLDHDGNNAYMMISQPGSISAEDALHVFNITQRSPRKIARMLNPSIKNMTDGGDTTYDSMSLLQNVTDKFEKQSHINIIQDIKNRQQTSSETHSWWESWSGGDGGWNATRLSEYEDDMSCDIDQYYADEITSQDLFTQYIATNTPVLIRGLIHDWPAIQQYRMTLLNSTYGDYEVQVSDIPYYIKFGGEGGENMKLRDYITHMRNQDNVGGNKYPWYVFRGHAIPKVSDNIGSFVPYDICPTPQLLQEAFDYMMMRSRSQPLPVDKGVDHHLDHDKGLDSSHHDKSQYGDKVETKRALFVNAQWAFGGRGTGAPVHHHNTAWNALIYGAKKWFLYPPHHQIMSNLQIAHYLDTDAQTFAQRTPSIRAKTCVQTAGDVIIVPESWGHGVLNIQESIAIATEVKLSYWRLHQSGYILSLLPDDNRKSSFKIKQEMRHITA